MVLLVVLLLGAGDGFDNDVSAVVGLVVVVLLRLFVLVVGGGVCCWWRVFGMFWLFVLVDDVSSVPFVVVRWWGWCWP